MKIISAGKATFKKDVTDKYQFHKGFDIYSKSKTKNQEIKKGGIYINWRPTTFHIGLNISIGKTGINIDTCLWISILFTYCWAI